MRAHLIKDGIVVNTLEVDSLDFMPDLVEATEGGIGWAYSDGNFTPPVDEDALSATEMARGRRDALLERTDWRAGSDLTMSDEWKAYRQALRDVPSQSGFPDSITWPEEPS